MTDPWQKKRRDHRARIDKMRAEAEGHHHNPTPLVKGGQGRSDTELVGSAGWILALLILVATLALCAWRAAR